MYSNYVIVAYTLKSKCVLREREIQYVSSIEITNLGGSYISSNAFHVLTFPHQCWSKTLRDGKNMKISISWKEYVFGAFILRYLCKPKWTPIVKVVI
jgi:hypothetical protein